MPGILIIFFAILLSACVTTDENYESIKPVFGPALSQVLQNSLEKSAVIQKADNLSASLYISDRCQWQGTVGFVNQDADRPVSADTLYSFGSITKTFIAAIILQLVEEKKLALDDELGKWLKAYRNIDPELTIRQLLNHGSGLYNFTENEKFWSDVDQDTSRIWSPEDTLEYVKSPPVLGFDPPRYSNTNYILLGLIIEAVTESSLEYELQHRIIRPLKLDNTGFVKTEFKAGKWANDSALYQSLYSGVWAAGAIASTAADISRWSHTLYSGNFLQQSSLTSMLTTEVRRLSSTDGMPMGLGVWQIRVDRDLAWGHGGRLGPFFSRTFYLPEYKLSVAHVSSGYEVVRPRAPGNQLVRAYLDHLPDDISVCFDT